MARLATVVFRDQCGRWQFGCGYVGGTEFVRVKLDDALANGAFERDARAAVVRLPRRALANCGGQMYFDCVGHKRTIRCFPVQHVVPL